MFGQPSTSPFAAPATNTAAGAATPFGAAPATGGFGAAAAPAPFGAQAPAPAGGFGGFGAPAPAPAAGGFGGFGAAPAPAAPAGAFGGFGSPTPAPGGFGAPAAPATPFGAPAPAPAAGGGLFGAAPTPAPGGGLFGAAPAPAPGAFGAPAPATGGFGGFGAPAPAPAFGAAPAPAAGGLFGSAPTPSTPAFGATTSPAGAFGAPAPAPSGGGLFGAAPAAAPSLFGAPAAGGAGKGTLVAPYQVTTRADGSSSISLQAITAMPQYESRSFEELRLEDYLAGNKGSSGQGTPGAAASGFGGFGAAPTPAPGAFGAPAAPTTGAFGAPAPAAGGLFGTPAPAPAPGAFGAPAPAAGGFGGFGAPAPAPASGGFGGFGAAAAPKPAASGGLFGAATAPAPGGSLFGASPAPAPGGLFGSAPAPAGGGLFGASTAPAPAPGGLFGTPAPAPAAGGLFGAPAPAAGGGLFGAPAPAPAAGGLFGAPAPAPASGAFGAAPAPAAGGLFGAPAPAPAAGGLFGSPAPAPAAGGLFGAPKPAGTGLFGSPAPVAPGAAGGSFFGAPAASVTPSLFGNSAVASSATPGLGTLGMAAPATVAPPTADALLAQQLAAVEGQKKELALLEAWRGNPPSGSSVIPASLSERDALVTRIADNGKSSRAGMASYVASSGGLVSYQSAPRSAAKIRPRGFGPMKSPPLSGTLTSGVGGGSSMLSPDAFLGSSAKRLVIKPGSLTPKPKMRLLLNGDTSGDTSIAPPEQGNREGGDSDGRLEPAAAGLATPVGGALGGQSRSLEPDFSPANGGDDSMPANSYASPAATTNGPLPDAAVTIPVGGGVDTPVARDGDAGKNVPGTPGDKELPSALKKKASSSNGGYGYDFYRQVVGSPAESDLEPPVSPNAVDGGSSRTTTPKKTMSIGCTPKLTKDGYDVTPSLNELSAMSEADLAAVSNFSVERAGFGSVSWDGAVDVRGVDLDAVVSIEARDVAVYDEEETNGTKPPVGSKLNRPAVIKMYNVFPKGGPDASREAMEKFERKIAKSTKKMGADLLSYDPASGIWKFRVGHFSRYAFVDDDSDNEDGGAAASDGPQSADASQEGVPSMDFESGGRGGCSPTTVQGVNADEKNGMLPGASIGGRSRIRAPRVEDEMSDQNEDESIELVSEGESSGAGHDAQILESAEAAYAAITPITDHDQCLVLTEDGAGRQEQANDLFSREGASLGEYVIGSSVVPTKEELCAAKGSKGICAQLAQRCGVTSATSSSTDFGMRMARSFRVGWRPDGSFIHPSLFQSRGDNIASWRGGVLVQSRPNFGGRSIPNAETLEVSLLETHLAHSIKSTVTDDCPTFSIPKPLGLIGGTASSYNGLCNMLNDYAATAAKQHMHHTEDGSDIMLLLSHAFSLLYSLYGQEHDALNPSRYGAGALLLPTDDTKLTSQHESKLLPSLDRRREAFSVWLRETVADDVKLDVKAAENHNDAQSAIFAAVTGGDLSLACSIAAEHGYLRLSSILANAGSLAGLDLCDQLQQWQDTGATAHMPPTLFRVYNLLSGDLGVEENLFKSGGSPFDWRRRLGMRLWCNNEVKRGGRLSFSSLVDQYETDVKNGIAPIPVPRYAEKQTRGGVAVQRQDIHCTLYRLLRLHADAGVGDGCSSCPLSGIISPLGYTPSAHDFSGAFHLASVLSALGCSSPLTALEEARLVDSYAAQLVTSGHWEWATYTFLCCLCDAGVSQSLVASRKLKAKELVLRFFTDDCRIDPLSAQRRRFLQDEIGVPPLWFEEALANRSFYIGDAKGYVKHLMQVSTREAAAAVEENFLPNLFFVESKTSQEFMSLLELLRDEDGVSLAGIIHDVVKLSEEVLQIARLPRDKRIGCTGHIKELHTMANQLQARMQESAESSLVTASTRRHLPRRLGRRFHGIQMVPRSCFIAESLSWLSLLRLQLRALASGVSIIEDQQMAGKSVCVCLKSASQLAFLTKAAGSSFDKTDSLTGIGMEGVIRGLV